MSFHVYILRCANGAFYVGYTENLEGRFEAHNAGRGSTYTRRNGPVTLVHSELHDTELDAMRREQQLKRWSRAKKQALIDSNMARLCELARSCRGATPARQKQEWKRFLEHDTSASRK